MPAIAIHTHPARMLRPYYLVTHLVELWRQAGIRVEVVGGPDPVPAVSIGLLHVDLTRVPPEYAALAGSYPVLLNGGVLDIGKRRLGVGLVERDSAYDGPVIVKSDLNAGGSPEHAAWQWGRTRAARAWSRLLDHVAASRPLGRQWRETYPVYPSKAQVPAWVWKRPDLVVQRFVADPLGGGEYALRQWTFFGESELSVVRGLSGPDRATAKFTTMRPGGDVPAELRALRREMRFDFGRFDYFLEDGRPMVIDVNKTPTYRLSSPLRREGLPRLAEGLKAWL
jgi:hypothetical protein